MKVFWVLLGLLFPHQISAQATYTQKVLTPETALKAAQAALKKCRDSGYQATIAVVDRMGVVQVLLRDRFAGPHTTDMATAKAWTDESTPERTRNAPISDSENVRMASRIVQTFSASRFSMTTAECNNAVPASQGMNDAFSTGSQNHQPPQPSS